MGKRLDQQPGQETMGGAIPPVAAVRAGTLAGSVNLFLPPSSHTVPMTLENGRQFPVVAFSTAGPTQGFSPRISQRNAAAKLKNARKSPPKISPRNGKYKYETDLEKLWRVETDRVELTFEKVQSDLQNIVSLQDRAKDKPFSMKKKDPMIAYRARMTMENVMDDMKDIVMAVNIAETKAKKQFDERAQAHQKSGDDQVNSSTSTTNSEEVSSVDEEERAADEPDSPSATAESLSVSEEYADNVADAELDAAALLCEEEIDNSEGHELTGDAVRELTVLAAQEATLLRQLAKIIRRKTLGMTEQRLRLVEDARKKA